MKKIVMMSVWAYLALGLSSCKYSQSEYDSAVNSSYSDGVSDGTERGFDNGYDVGHTDGYAQGYAKGLLDAGNLDYNDGYADGDADGYSRGYSAGENVGYNNGYNNGYGDGDADGYADGYTIGAQDGYDEGYQDGFDEGVIVSYDEGYVDGLDDGYGTGYDDGYVDGDADGYSSGLDDGYDIGYDDGFDYGYDEGYSYGYDDGWYDAGGNSTGVKSKAQLLTSTLLNDLIDFGKMKSPKDILNDEKTKKLLLSSTAGMTVDTKKKKAILNKYVVGAMKNQLIAKFGLSEDRSLKLAKLANQMIKASNSGEVKMESVNAFSEKALGSTVTSMENAFKKSLSGSSTEMTEIINKAAKVNGVSLEHAQTIMTKIMM